MPRADWPEAIIWAPFERGKVEIHIFERANLSGFATWHFIAKEDLNAQKQALLLLIEDSGTPKNQRFGLLFMGKSLY